MSIRIAFPAAALVLALAVSACGGPRGTLPSYSQEMDRLTQDCRERGGILTPIPGAATGRPQTDYACQIRGGGSRIG